MMEKWLVFIITNINLFSSFTSKLLFFCALIPFPVDDTLISFLVKVILKINVFVNNCK